MSQHLQGLDSLVGAHISRIKFSVPLYVATLRLDIFFFVSSFVFACESSSELVTGCALSLLVNYKAYVLVSQCTRCFIIVITSGNS